MAAPAVEVPFYFTLTRALSVPPESQWTAPFTSIPPILVRRSVEPTISRVAPSPRLCPAAMDQRPIEGRSDVVVFTSDPDRWERGRSWTHLRRRVDRDRSSRRRVFVRMTDVYPTTPLDADGARDQRARYRNGTCPQLLVLNRRRKSASICNRPRSSSAGHKLRVIVSASAGPNHLAAIRSTASTPERRRIHRRASECNRIDQGARRDRSPSPSSYPFLLARLRRPTCARTHALSSVKRWKHAVWNNSKPSLLQYPISSPSRTAPISRFHSSRLPRKPSSQQY